MATFGISAAHVLIQDYVNLNMENVDLINYDIQQLHHHVLSRELMCRYKIIPLDIKAGTLHIGVSQTIDQYTVDAITFQTGMRTFPILIPEDQLHAILEKLCQDNENHFELSLLDEIALEENPHILQENAINYDEPLIKFVDYVIKHAIQQSASDIHIEPYANHCRIRFRCDGLLNEITRIPLELALRFITRLKVMARLDISERRLPQDGRFKLHSIDIRINTCPTLFGEKIVLRLLDANKLLLDLHTLGFSTTQKELFISKISKPHGLILVTGPTGCGKTVTLYSALNYLNKIDKNISTVEDPIEIQLMGINQVSIQPKIGLEFATVLRSLLRQDPDIIMLGEIRDKETADIAIQAAHTGHLVLSTLHTNSAIETITRLTAMGISAYNIASAISLIIAQRLVRKLCETCKQPETTALLPELSDGHQIYRANSCKQCLQGYKGRTGIYELLPFSDEIMALILSGDPHMKIKNMMKRKGYHSLHDSAKEKVLQGSTSLVEMHRVLQL